MSRALVTLALLLSAACAQSTNPCAGQPGICVVIEVRGGVVDQLSMTAVTATRTIGGSTAVDGPLPVQFAALLPDDTDGPILFEIIGLRAAAAVAVGSGTLAVPPSGQRLVVNLVDLPPGSPPPDLANPPRFDLTGAPLHDLARPEGDLALATSPDLSACVRATCGTVTCGSIDDGCGTPVVCGPPCKLGPFSSAGFTLSPGRTAYALVQTATHVFLIGGQDDTVMPTTSVQSAPINADGSLGAFSEVGPLLVARDLVAATTGNGFVYVSGGTSNDSTNVPLATIEKATILADGTIGPFSSAGANMINARMAHKSAVIAGFLYVFGGQNTAAIASVERAPIQPDGTLGAFAAAGNLTTPRQELALLVTTGFVYAIGGGDLSSVDRAPITGGGVGTFTDAGVHLVIRRGGPLAIAIGSDVFILGGAFHDVDGGSIFFPPAQTYPTSIEHATLDANGTLGALALFPNSALETGRAGHGVAVTSSSVFVLGGFNGGTTPLSSVERATRQ